MSTDLTEQKPDQKAEQAPELETAAHSTGWVDRASAPDGGVAVGVPPPAPQLATRTGVAVVLQRLPAPVPGEGAGPGAEVAVLLRLGFIAIVLFTVLVVTGVYLMFFYSPTPAAAYGDMVQLKTGIGFGQLVRNVHRWSAHLMVLVVVVHLVRVFYAGAYKRPRQFNWVLGIALLLITLGFSFTGYLLPWDQLSYWAVTVGTNMVNYVPLVGKYVRDILLGGKQISGATLQRFYALHVAILPLSLTLILPVHIWRVRKDGFAVERGSTGASTPRPAPVGRPPPLRWRPQRRMATAMDGGSACWVSSTESPLRRRSRSPTTRCSPGHT